MMGSEKFDRLSDQPSWVPLPSKFSSAHISNDTYILYSKSC